MTRPESVPADAWRDMVVAVARGQLADAGRVDWETASAPVVAGLIGGLTQSIADLLDVVDDGQEASQ